jgi:hypothetical protein
LQWRYPDDTPLTYEQRFKELLAAEEITMRGLKPDAKVFDEMVFDVNTAYFDERGGYEYAKSFFEEAYRCAVKEIGGEQYILSAVMHADERNKALSQDLGRDVYHYHLHVVYVPVVEKQIFYRKDCKDKAKAGQLKEVITQISHSKKWPLRMKVERDGETVTLNSYSMLQDRYHDHMKAAGFDGFERGKHGVSREHLSDTEYKAQQEQKRVAAAAELADRLDAENAAKIEEGKETTRAIEKKLKQLTTREKDALKGIDELEDIDRRKGKTLLGGDVTLRPDDYNTLYNAAYHGLQAYNVLAPENRQYKTENKELRTKVANLQEILRKNTPTNIAIRGIVTPEPTQDPNHMKEHKTR